MNLIVWSNAFGANFLTEATCTALNSNMLANTGYGVTCSSEQLAVGTVLQQGVGDSGTSDTVGFIGTEYVAGSSSGSTSTCTTALSSDCFSSAGITPADIAYVYAWGVAAVLTLFGLGIAVSAAVKAIRMA